MAGTKVNLACVNQQLVRCRLQPRRHSETGSDASVAAANVSVDNADAVAVASSPVLHV
jgi:hypothetical protein